MLLLFGGLACVEPRGSEATDHNVVKFPALAKKCDKEDVAGLEVLADDLGRILTSPGLCSIEGSKVQTSDSFGPEYSIVLSLSYDDSGRPTEAGTWFSRFCDLEYWNPLPPSSDDDPACDDMEEHTQTWRWGENGQLESVDYTVRAEFFDPGEDAERCYFVEEPMVTDKIRWSYDEAGRVEASSGMSADCEGTQTILEQVSYGQGRVDSHVTIKYTEVSGEPGGWAGSWYAVVDECGRVVAAPENGNSDNIIEYTYDNYGRLVQEAGGRKTKVWGYDAMVAAGTRAAWAFEASVDGREFSISSSDQQVRNQYVVRVDNVGRVVGVESNAWVWKLGYGDCIHADRATASWRVGDLFWAWDFPDMPIPGEGAGALDYWLSRDGSFDPA